MVVLSEPVCRALAETSIAEHVSDPNEQTFLVDTALAVRDFSLGNNAAPMPAGEDYRNAITPDAIAHLLDVRVVFLASELAFFVLFLALTILMIVAVRRTKAGSRVGYLVRPLIIGGIIPLVAALLLAIVIAVDFGAFFVWMHGIFFADGTWTFPADSLLIRSLPYKFWIASAFVWAGSMVLLCVISIAVGILLVRLGRRAKSEAFDAR